MGKTTKKSKNNEKQTNGTKKLAVTSVIMAVLSPIFFWGSGLINTYYDVSDFRAQYSIVLLASAVFAIVGFVVSLIAAIKITSGKRYIYILCTLVTLGVALLELISVAFLNWYGV